ncbi:MAG TPA: oligosaccharide repeat unit polymerase [Lysobacter sp.]
MSAVPGESSGGYSDIPGLRAVAPVHRFLRPVPVFICAYCVYNLLGLMPAPWLLEDAYSKSLPWQLFLLGLAGLVAGAFVSRLISTRTIRQLSRGRAWKARRAGVVFFALLFVCLAVTVVRNRGIPLLMGEARFENSALMFNLSQLCGLWMMLKSIIDLEEGRLPNVVLCAVYIGCMACFGYRTPVIVFILVMACHLVLFRLRRSLSVPIIAASALALLLFASVSSGFRVGQSYDKEAFFVAIDYQYVDDHPLIAPLVPALSMFDFSQRTVSGIGDGLDDHMLGGLFLSNYETLLPGTHWGARNIVGDITSARWVGGRPMSITPTLQGALFIDFGPIGVAVGFLFLGIVLAVMYRIAAFQSGIGRFVFCYVFALALMSIHNGYWDLAFPFFVMFVLLAVKPARRR